MIKLHLCIFSTWRYQEKIYFYNNKPNQSFVDLFCFNLYPIFLVKIFSRKSIFRSGLLKLEKIFHNENISKKFHFQILFAVNKYSTKKIFRKKFYKIFNYLQIWSVGAGCSAGSAMPLDQTSLPPPRNSSPPPWSSSSPPRRSSFPPPRSSSPPHPKTVKPFMNSNALINYEFIFLLAP